MTCKNYIKGAGCVACGGHAYDEKCKGKKKSCARYESMTPKNVCGECRHEKYNGVPFHTYCERNDEDIHFSFDTSDCKDFEKREDGK